MARKKPRFDLAAQVKALGADSLLPAKKLHVPKPEWFKDYEIRTGGDGKVGIYTRDYNCRLATFNCNTAALQTRLRLLFEHANAPPKPKRRKRAPAGSKLGAWGPGSGNW